MRSFIFLTLYILKIVSSADEDNGDILCTKTACDDVVCSTLPDNCKIQNATHNGLFLPSPTTCNCCEYCLENMNEGDECTVGNPANPSPTSICGPGLACKVSPGDDFDGVCSRMETDCMKQQDWYDEKKANGTLGAMEVRQNCDDDGLFSSYKCIPGQTCFCLDKNGNRIFGDADYTTLGDYIMECKCSRDYVTAVELIGTDLNPSQHFRCTANGDYDELQCFGDKCLCVDPSDGAPSYPDSSLVNMTSISKETLPCYREETPGIYYRACEAEYTQVLKEVEVYENDGYDLIFLFEFPKCDIDGTYQAVQENSTHKYCVSKEGDVLTAVSKTDAIADSMDCKCLRASSTMTTDEKPSCDTNGNYSPVQCRRGTCRCVDSDGVQVCTTQSCEVDEVDKDTLKCE